MVEIGYSLSCEEHPPSDLVRYAQQAEESGFTYAMISDHYHPWIGAQDQSAFVWSVIGAIAQVTTRLQLGTGVSLRAGPFLPHLLPMPRRSSQARAGVACAPRRCICS